MVVQVAEFMVDELAVRPARLADAEAITKLTRDPSVRQSLSWLPQELETVRKWLDDASPGMQRLVIISRGELLGAMTLESRRTGTSELSCWVDASARGQGVATRVVRELSRRPSERGVHRWELASELTNVPAQRVAVAAGFSREGVRRSSRPNLDGGWDDEVVWARLADDPPGPTARALPDLPGGELTDGELTLRCADVGDTEDVHVLFNLPDVQARLSAIRPRSHAEIRQRCALAAPRWLGGERADMVIRRADTGEFVGDTQLMLNAWLRQAEIGFNVVPQWRGRGYAARAVRMVSNWAFAELGVLRVMAGTAPDNPASQAVLIRAGFHHEATHVAKIPSPYGGRYDQLVFIRLRLGSEGNGRRDGLHH